MTAKKYWLNKVYHNSQECFQGTQVDITWSSSDSEDETKNYRHIRKKKRLNTTYHRVGSKWIKSNVEENKSNIFYKNRVTNYNILDGEKDIADCVDKCNKIENDGFDRKEYQDISSSESSSGSSKSPILKGKNLKLSPVICNSSGPELALKMSPIIGKHNILNKLKIDNVKNHTNVQHMLTTYSPEIFSSQSGHNSSEYHIENNSPVKATQECSQIDHFPSQFSSQVVSNTSSSLNNSLYHQPPPKKKTFKKGSVRAALQKVLTLQRARTSIWQHEMYLKKTDNMLHNENEVMKFTINKKWKEYGSIILKCTSIDNMWKIKDVQIPSATKFNGFFILIIGYGVTLNFELDKNCRYMFFPPYSVKSIMYELQDMCCYYNVTKLIPYKD